MKRIPFILALTVLLGIVYGSYAQDENRDGSYILMPLSSKEEIQLQSLPELKMPPGYGNRDLPYMVDNSTQLCMRPAFQQAGLCCGQASSIGYNFTYEMSRERELNASLLENQYPTHFAWNFMNGGDGYYGVSYLHSLQILKEFGMPNAVDYGGSLSYGGASRWMSGYTEYFNGMHNRINNAYQIQAGTPEGLLVLKHWLHSHLEDSEIGGIASFYAQHMSATQMLPYGTPEAGKYVLTYFGGSANHAMTIVGYNDSIRWDYNEDGQYTNDIDINSDGVVNMKDWEIGGFKMVQSYGGVPNWGDQGFAYMMYKTIADNIGNGGIWNHCVHVLDVKETYDPKLTARIILKHSRRELIKVLVGISNNISQPKPQVILGYPIYDYQGGNKFMQGGTAESDKTITFGLDLSKLLSYIELDHDVRVYLQVVEDDPANGYTGEIIHFSIYDHTAGGTETTCMQSNVPIANNDTTTLSVTHTFNFDRVTILDESIPPAPQGEYYSHQLTAAGGTPPFTWEFDKSYEESNQTASFPMITANQLSPSNNSGGFAMQTLGFDFPFYDSAYSSIAVHVDGYLMFDQQLYPFPYYQEDNTLFNITRNIAPYLNYHQEVNGGQGGGIWYEGDDQYATFRWKTSLAEDPTTHMNYAVRLFPDGTIKFFYGPMDGCDEYTWIAGISDGDNVNSQTTAISNKPTITANKSTTLLPYNYPPEMEISPEGLLTGTPQQSYGGEQISFKVTDNNFIFDTKSFIFTSSGIIVQDSVISGGDPVIAFGETAWMNISVINVKPDPVLDATMTIHIDDPFITLADSTEDLGDIIPGEVNRYFNAFHFMVSEDIPNNHLITIQTIINSDTNTFESNLFHYAYAPIVTAEEVVVADENGRLDAGDTTNINISFLNAGGVEITSLYTILVCQDPFITINQNFANIPLLGVGQVIEVPFNLTVSADCPPGHTIDFDLEMSGDGNYTAIDSFNLVVGLFREDFETGDMTLFTWGNDGNRDWTIDNNAAFEGYFSARSGIITHNEESVMQIDMNVLSDGEIGFYQRTTCEDDTSSANNFDYLCFRIDGTEMGRWDGETSWTFEEFPVTAGIHRFEWIYHKDNSSNYRSDAAWVDYITFPSAVDCSPSILSEAGSFDFLMRTDETETATLVITNAAPGSLNYTLDIAGIEPAEKGPVSGGRNIAGSYLVIDAEKIHTGVEYAWNLRTYNGGIDNEWIKEIYVTFPPGMDLVAASDFVGGSGGDMVFQGPFGNGVTAYWFGEDQSGWGVVHMGETALCNLSVIPEADLQGDLIIDFEVKGEVYGGTPHDVIGNIPIRNLGPEIPWLSLDTTAGYLAGEVTDSLQLAINTEGMADGDYQAWIILLDNFNSEIIIPVNLTIDTYMDNPGGAVANSPRISINPNPFTDKADIRFSSSKNSRTRLEIFTLQGHIVQSLEFETGNQHLIRYEWDGCDRNGITLPSGLYLIKVQNGASTEFARVVIIR